MWFDIDASGINIKLRIKGYKPLGKYNWDSEWCKCDFLFASGDWLNYHKEDDEVLLSCEIEGLEEALTKLTNNEITEVEEISCIEPDFKFVLYPWKDKSDDTKYTYVQLGYELQDIYLEWKIFFWNQGLTDNYLSIAPDREKIKSRR